MLPYLLALVVAVAGIALYGTAFFVPNLYRKNDLIWSGVALFYALVLWFCAKRITGAVLLGQTASVALIGWLGFQAWQRRWEQLPSDDRASIADGSTVKEGWSKLKATDWKEVAQTTTDRVKGVASEAAASVASVKDTVAEKTTASSGVKTAAGGSTPIAAVTDVVVKLKGLVQGRKTHGKKYVRPESSDTATADIGAADWVESVKDAATADVVEAADAEENAPEPEMVAVADPVAEVNELEAVEPEAADEPEPAEADEPVEAETTKPEESEEAIESVAALDAEPEETPAAPEPNAVEEPEGVEANEPVEAATIAEEDAADIEAAPGVTEQDIQYEDDSQEVEYEDESQEVAYEDDVPEASESKEGKADA